MDLGEVVGDKADPDPLLVGQAELAAGVELAVEFAQVAPRVALVVWLGQEAVENPCNERVQLQDVDGPRVGKVQSSQTGILAACLFLQ